MGIISRGLVLASAALGLAVTSQAPEFAQQYRQRLGGAVDELHTVVSDLDRDAERFGMTRADALHSMIASQTGFIRERGLSMTRTVARYEMLAGQLAALETAPPLTRPLIVVRQPDSHIVGAAWEVFEPAVPLTLPGLVYGGVGALLLGLLSSVGIRAGRTMRAGARRPAGGAGTQNL